MDAPPAPQGRLQGGPSHLPLKSLGPFHVLPCLSLAAAFSSGFVAYTENLLDFRRLRLLVSLAFSDDADLY